ncbi:hypothetical protein BpHYR1_050740 [Brachionus plicatilis]|uniref:Uncharacterized protein n=1 Tax=Brachionus plicatilis TaxID=10195 RepID=A0A3M7RIK5_BRAPC|nr:hypothetical protein BpHYR1_050740 [Brachionus plicatilis]
MRNNCYRNLSFNYNRIFHYSNLDFELCEKIFGIIMFFIKIISRKFLLSMLHLKNEIKKRIKIKLEKIRLVLSLHSLITKRIFTDN